MDTVTYPDQRVEAFMEQHAVPVKVAAKENPQLLEEYAVGWTPNVVIADDQGRVHYRIEGYLPPEDFVGLLSLGIGKYWLNHQQADRAEERFDGAARRHAGTEIGAQALYWLGVARYKRTKAPAQLRATWEQLAREYPHSDWTKRSQIPASG
jgi:hypothetical protein